MFEEVLKAEINNIFVVILRETKSKDSQKSKNYRTTYYYQEPEEETYKTLYKMTFLQALKHFMKTCKSLKNGTKIEKLWKQ